MRPRHAVLLTPSISLRPVLSPSRTPITRQTPLIPSFVLKVLRTLPSFVSRKSCSCHSYANCRGVYQQFPFWNSILANQETISYSLSPNYRICHTSENSPVSPIIATDPKTHLSKSCICHTSDIPPGVTLASPTLVLPHPQAFQRFLQLSPIPFLFTFLRTLLHFCALSKNSTPLFSIGSALFAKNHRGWGRGCSCSDPVGNPLSCYPARRSIPATVKNRGFSGCQLVEYSSFVPPRTRRREATPPASAAMLPSIRAQMRTWR